METVDFPTFSLKSGSEVQNKQIMGLDGGSAFEPLKNSHALTPDHSHLGVSV